MKSILCFPPEAKKALLCLLIGLEDGCTNSSTSLCLLFQDASNSILTERVLYFLGGYFVILFKCPFKLLLSLPYNSAGCAFHVSHTAWTSLSVKGSAYRKPAFQPSAFRRFFIGFQPSAKNQPPCKKYGINYMIW